MSKKGLKSLEEEVVGFPVGIVSDILDFDDVAGASGEQAIHFDIPQTCIVGYIGSDGKAINATKQPPVQIRAALIGFEVLAYEFSRDINAEGCSAVDAYLTQYLRLPEHPFNGMEVLVPKFVIGQQQADKVARLSYKPVLWGENFVNYPGVYSHPELKIAQMSKTENLTAALQDKTKKVKKTYGLSDIGNVYTHSLAFIATCARGKIQTATVVGKQPLIPELKPVKKFLPEILAKDEDGKTIKATFTDTWNGDTFTIDTFVLDEQYSDFGVVNEDGLSVVPFDMLNNGVYRQMLGFGKFTEDWANPLLARMWLRTMNFHTKIIELAVADLELVVDEDFDVETIFVKYGFCDKDQKPGVPEAKLSESGLGYMASGAPFEAIVSKSKPSSLTYNLAKDPKGFFTKGHCWPIRLEKMTTKVQAGAIPNTGGVNLGGITDPGMVLPNTGFDKF